MPAFKFKLPSLEELKGSSPKQLLIDHGEKIVLAACVVVFLAAIVGAFAGGGGVSSTDMQALIKKLDNLKRQPVDPKAPPPIPVIDVRGEVAKWDTRPAMTTVLAKAEAHVGLRKVIGASALVKTGDEIRRHPDVRGALRVRDLRCYNGHAWLLDQVRANPEDVDKFKRAEILWKDIRVDITNKDVQWVEIVGWCDLRELVWDYQVMNNSKALRDKRRLVLPTFQDLEVQRRDLSLPPGKQRWERVAVPMPLVDQEVEILRAKPRPPEDVPVFIDEEEDDRDVRRRGGGREVREKREIETWPPERVNIWKGGPGNLGAVVRRNPAHAPDGTGTEPRIPRFIRDSTAEGLPGGIFYNLDSPAGLWGVLVDRMSKYLNARYDLLDPTLDEAVRVNRLRDVQRPYGMALRFLDTTVKPGHSYAYRVAVLVRNPCADPLINAAEKARKPEVLRTEFSAPSPIISVPRKAEFFFKLVVPSPNGIERGLFDIHMLKRGAWRIAEVSAMIGERIAGTGRIQKRVPLPPDPREARHGRKPPPRSKVVVERVQLDTGAILLDILTEESVGDMIPTRAMRRPDGQTVQVRDWLKPVIRRPVTQYTALYVDEDGRIGSAVMGEMPPYAKERREAARKAP